MKDDTNVCQGSRQHSSVRAIWWWSLGLYMKRAQEGQANRLDLGDTVKYWEWHSLASEVTKSKQKVFLGSQVLLLQYLCESFEGLAETKQFHFITSPCKKVSKFQWPGFTHFCLFRLEWSYTDVLHFYSKPFLSHPVSSPSSWAHGFCVISVWSHQLVPSFLHRLET